MPQHTTASGRKKLPPEVVRWVRRTHGLSTRIAQRGHFSRSFVSRVLAGEKPPSGRFLTALAAAIAGLEDLDELPGGAALKRLLLSSLDRKGPRRVRAES